MTNETRNHYGVYQLERRPETKAMMDAICECLKSESGVRIRYTDVLRAALREYAVNMAAARGMALNELLETYKRESDE